MTNQQQPECPAEYQWMRPGVRVALKDDAWHGRGISCILTAKSEPYLPPDFDKWVIETDPDYGLLMWCEELLPAPHPAISSHGAALLMIADLNRTIGDQKEDAESIRGRLEEAEARASAEAAKLERVKALLDGVGPEIAAFDLQHSDLLYGQLSCQQFGEWCANQMPDFVLKTQAVWEVLKGE